MIEVGELFGNFLLSISESSTVILRLICWSSIIVLPGTWITFSLRTEIFSFSQRLLAGVMLAPLAVFIQFYFFRLLGAPFDLTSFLLVLVNLPAILLVWRNSEGAKLPDRKILLGGGAMAVVALACLAPQLYWVDERMFTGHAWMHADIIYLIRNGQLLLQDPELSGIRLAYPWTGHVYQAVLSFLLDSPPTSSYIWTNLVWLVCFLGFCVGIVREFTINRFSQMTSFIWLLLGLNFFGMILVEIMPSAWVDRLWIGGDYRYTPWVLKFYFFEQIIFGLGMFAVLGLVAVKRWKRQDAFANSILIVTLLVGIGFVYPIIFVPAAFVAGAKSLGILWLERDNPDTLLPLKYGTSLVLIIFVSGFLTAVYLQVLTADRISSAINLPSLNGDYLKYTLRKAQGTAVAMAIFVVSFLFVVRKFAAKNQTGIFVLATGAVASIALNLLLEIPYWGNEYKFLLSAAICMMPFPVLFLEPAFNRLHSTALPAFILITALLATPFAYRLYNDFPWRKRDTATGELKWRPETDSTHFDLTLEKTEHEYELCNAIRNTPQDTILVIERSNLHFPTVTQRGLFAPPHGNIERPGVNIQSVELLANIRGYGQAVVEDRKKIVRELFTSSDVDRQNESLHQILGSGLPVGIVVGKTVNPTLQELLRSEGGTKIFDDRNFELWYFSPSRA